MSKAPKSKRQADPTPVPQSATEASTMLADLGAEQRDLAVIQAALDEAVAAAKAKAEADAAPVKTRIAAMERGLEIWATANRQALTDGGKTKTITLPAGTLAWRAAPPSVSIKGVREVLGWLVAEGGDFAGFLRTKAEIDKEAMLKDPALAAKVPGVTIGSTGEAFVVEPAGAVLAPAAAA